MRWSIAARNAASVFPEPVGASTSTLSPSAIAGQASSCARVGVWNVASNQARVAGLKLASGSLPTRHDATSGPAVPHRYQDNKGGPPERAHLCLMRSGAVSPCGPEYFLP